MATERRNMVYSLGFATLILLFVFMSYRMGEEARYVREYDINKTPSLINIGAIDRFDQLRASLNTNYPVCDNLPRILEDVEKDEENLSKSTDHYKTLIERDELHCGNMRTLGSMWIFGRKHLEPWKSTCAENIVPGKRRMYDYLKALCDHQNEHNRLHVSEKHSAHVASSLRWGNRNGAKYGVIMTGKTTHFKNIYQAILALRRPPLSTGGGGGSGGSGSGSGEHQPPFEDHGWNKHLDVEVWVGKEDLSLCKRVFVEGESSKPLKGVHTSSDASEDTVTEDGSEHHSDHIGSIGSGSVTCRALPDKILGFTSKFYALLGTDFTDVLFLDSDNIMVRDASELFTSQAYRDTGSLIWPDLWGDRCLAERGTLGSIDKGSYGYTAFHTHVLFKARVGGLQWQNTRPFAQEAEAGQIVFDLRRHGGLLHLGRLLIEDEQFYKRIFNGDKDIFRIVHLITGEPFTFVRHLPGYSTATKGRDCLTHFFGPQGDPGYTEEGSIWRGFSSSSSSARTLDVSPTHTDEGTADTDVRKKDWFLRFGASIGAIFGGENHGKAPDALSRNNPHYDYVSFKNTAKRAEAEAEAEAHQKETKVKPTVKASAASAGAPQARDAPSSASSPTTTVAGATAIATHIEADMTKGGFVPSSNGQLYVANQKGLRGKGQSNSPMFYHQLKQRNAEAFGTVARISPRARLDPSACIDCTIPGNLTDALLFPEKYVNLTTQPYVLRGTSTRSTENSKPFLTVEHVDNGDDLVRFAQHLFDTTDSVWGENFYDVSLFLHETISLGSVGSFVGKLAILVIAFCIACIGVLVCVGVVKRSFGAAGGGGASHGWMTLSLRPNELGARKRADSARPDLLFDVHDGVDSANTNTFKAMELSSTSVKNARGKPGAGRR